MVERSVNDQSELIICEAYLFLKLFFQLHKDGLSVVNLNLSSSSIPKLSRNDRLLLLKVS